MWGWVCVCVCVWGGGVTWIQQDNSNEDGRMRDTTIKMQFATYLGCTEWGGGWRGVYNL